MAQMRMDLSCFRFFERKRMPNMTRWVIKLLLVWSFLAWIILFSLCGLVPKNPSLSVARKNAGSCITENPLSIMFDEDDTIGLGNCSFRWGSRNQVASVGGPSRDKIQDTIANWQYDKSFCPFCGETCLGCWNGPGSMGCCSAWQVSNHAVHRIGSCCLSPNPCQDPGSQCLLWR